MERTKNAPIKTERAMAFVDYADRPGELTEIEHPVYHIPSYCLDFRDFRIEKRISLLEAARILNMKASELSGIEHGRYAATEAEVQEFINKLSTRDTGHE